MTIRCEACGVEYGVGGFPFCKGGHGQYRIHVIDDQLEGGPRRFETMGADAPFISSKSEWRREAAARGLIQVDKHDRAYYNAKFRQHDEQIKDTGKYSDHGL
jgi:hypothetical protein